MHDTLGHPVAGPINSLSRSEAANAIAPAQRNRIIGLLGQASSSADIRRGSHQADRRQLCVGADVARIAGGRASVTVGRAGDVTRTLLDEDAPITDPAVRRGLVEVKTHLMVLDALGRRCVWAASVGAPHKSCGPMTKLFGSESWVTSSVLLMRLAASRSLLRGFNANGEIEKRSRRAIPGMIHAGTGEIHRRLIA